MNDLIWVITSSALILAVLLIRLIFGKRMSAGIRYALWAVVLIRLLVPGTFFKSPVSVQTAAEKAGFVRDIESVRGAESLTYSEEKQMILAPVRQERQTEAVTQTPSPFSEEEAVPVARIIERDATPERFERMQAALKVSDVLKIVWLTGMGIMLAYVVYVNVRFYLKLRDRRKLISGDSKCRVYSVEGLESSCLFLGSVYVSAEQAGDPDRLNCVLEHELAHRRHFDGVFTVLRSAALILHWYNPLVWAAAYASRQDSELFADAGAVKALGENRRESYGRTLIALSARPSVRASIACTATSMANNKHALKERVKNIAPHRRMGVLIAAAVLVLSLAAAGCAFLGSAKTGSPDAFVPMNSEEPTQAPTAAPTEAPTAEPTAEPTEAPTAAPAGTPVPDDWFIERAMNVEQDIRVLYGLDVNPVSGIRRSEEGEPDHAVVYFGSLNDNESPYIEMHFAPRSKGGSNWSLECCYVHIPGEADQKQIDADRIAFGSYFNIDVTPDELKEAGFNQLSGDAGVESAVAFVLNSLAERLTNLPADDTLLCRDAKPVFINYDSSYPVEGGMEYNYDGIIAALPLHPGAFEFEFAEASNGWLYLGEEHPECRYYQGIAVLLSCTVNNDGTFRVYAEIDVMEVMDDDDL